MRTRNYTPIKIRPLPSCLLAGLCAVLQVASAQAQPSSAPARSADKPDGGDEAITLSEFAVQSGTDKGYIASESITGSRVATAIKDLPFQVNVITSEFLEDFGFFDFTENVGYTSSLGAVDNGGNNTVRGYTSQYMLRDGFFRLGMNDKVNVDRIEVIKGPSAAIYGEAQPGGMVNVITKHPKKVETPQVSASVTLGSYNTFRSELTATGAIPKLGKTYFLVTAADYERTFDTPMTTLRNRSASVSLEHDFGGGGSLLVEYSYMRNQTHSVQSTVPELYNATTKRYEGLATDLTFLQQNGPQSETSRDVNDVTVTFEQKLSDIFSVRVAGDWYHRHKWLFNAGNGSQYDYQNGILAKGTVAEGLIGEDGGGLQADLLARYKLFGDKVTNKSLLTFDFSDYYRFDPTWQLPSNSPMIINNTATTVAPGAPGTYWFKNIIIGQPIDYSVPAFSPAVYTNITRYNKNRASIWGANFRQQSGFFHDKLLTYAGVRFDDVKFVLRNYLNGTSLDPAHGVTLKTTSKAWSPNFGFNYKATSNVAFYGSRSNGFNANAQNRTASNGTQPNETSYGYDYGVKCDFLDERLIFTVSGYYIVRRNVADTELLPNGTTVTAYSGSQLARGAEFDLTYRVTDDLTFLTGGDHTNAKYTYFGRNIGAVGYPTTKVPTDHVYGVLKYVFGGSLTGFSANAGFIYNSKTSAENPNTGDTFAAASAGGAYLGNDGRRDIKIPSYYTVDVGLHYKIRTEKFARLNHTIDFFVKNLTNKFYINAARQATDGRGYYVGYRLGY